METLITYPITQTHADVPADVLAANGITDRILRLSVGIEDVQDLINEWSGYFMSKERIDFDERIDRKNTSCIKYDFAVSKGKTQKESCRSG